MRTTLKLGAVTIDVVRKDIKNVHLSVYPPAGKVRISAPLRMDVEIIRVFAASKLSWIKQQQKKLTAQERETPREYIERESHYVWGKRFLLQVAERDGPPQIELRHNQMRMQSALVQAPNADRKFLRSGTASNSEQPFDRSSRSGSG